MLTLVWISVLIPILNEIYPSLFQPFGGFPDSSTVENSYVTFPKFIGMGYEKKEKLITLFKELFN